MHPVPQLAPLFQHLAAHHWLIEPGQVFETLADTPDTCANWVQLAGFAAWPHVLAQAGLLPAHDRFAEWYERTGQDHQFKRDVATDLLALFRDAGILAMPLKGLHTGLHLYPDPVMRPFTDLDLLVPFDHKQKTEQLLIRYGYLPTTLSVPRGNFEWVFDADELPLLEIHFDLLPRWRLPWDGADQLLARPAEDMALDLHALHALAHFAQHKGALRPIQELELKLLLANLTPESIPDALLPAWTLWAIRNSDFWQAPTSTAVRRTLLKSLYRSTETAWGEPSGLRVIRERLLGLSLSTRFRGWISQLLGNPEANPFAGQA